MKKLFVMVTILLAVLTALFATACYATGNDIAILINEVNSDYVLDNLVYLTSFTSRSSYEVQEEIIDFIGTELGNAGAIIQLHEYEFAGQPWHNLVATVPANASLEPTEPHFVMGAHIDSIPTSPGADDNASGVAAIMEAARVLANAELTTRVDFVFFTKEESGRNGSKSYAADARASGEEIVAVVVADMVGYYGPGNDDLDLETVPSTDWIAYEFKEAVDTYNGELPTTLRIQEDCG